MISSEIVRVVDGETLNAKDLFIKEVKIDSRDVSDGDMFIALRGKYKDGHDFIPQALSRGARVVISEKPIDAPCIVVKDSQQALIKLANFYRMQFNIPIIAVCGSAGKTTTKELIYWILKYHFKQVHKNFLNENNVIGVCKTLFGLKRYHQVLVIELGTNTQGEIEMLSHIVNPTHVVITNVKKVHLEGLGSIDGVAKEKLSVLSLLTDRDTFIWNVDDSEITGYVTNNSINFKGKVISFGSKEADFTLLSVKDSIIAVKHRLWGTKEFIFPLKGSFNAINAVAALATASDVCELSPFLVQKALLSFKGLPLRMEEKILHGVKFYLDCYNSNPDAVKATVDAICDVEKEFIVILGDMLELGKDKISIHQEIGEYLAKKDNIRFFIGFGDSMSHAVERFKKYRDDALFFYDLKEVAKFLIVENKDKIPVFIKGSRAMHMEKIVGIID
ncbi:MAG: UDP-N-acetylmuramoyl-tripeptide--D-alanyl-D-alanine ligase [Deltaproteobacteria bacterium]|nr:UDP-N-acetylmuramoyl-tripeptide--D-alanyl-D-alanine ligase [Deltaproteobacteria bacterium]